MENMNAYACNGTSSGGNTSNNPNKGCYDVEYVGLYKAPPCVCGFSYPNIACSDVELVVRGTLRSMLDCPCVCVVFAKKKKSRLASQVVFVMMNNE